MDDDQVPDHDPWDERDAYLDEGHDEPEVDAEQLVDADEGEDPLADQ